MGSSHVQLLNVSPICYPAGAPRTMLLLVIVKQDYNAVLHKNFEDSKGRHAQDRYEIHYPLGQWIGEWVLRWKLTRSSESGRRGEAIVDR